MAAAYPELGIEFVEVAIAFRLTVVAMTYGIGHISGCHLNPAVSIGLWVGGRLYKKELLLYIAAQELRGITSAGYSYNLLIEKAIGR